MDLAYEVKLTKKPLAQYQQGPQCAVVLKNNKAGQVENSSNSDLLRALGINLNRAISRT